MPEALLILFDGCLEYNVNRGKLINDVPGVSDA